jgi:hypothetical protein
MGLLLIHAAATWFMVGLIWVIQVVHYPLFLRIGAAEFVDYERAHTRRMGALLAFPASLEVVTGALLVWIRPDGVPAAMVFAAGAVLAAIWVMTALVQARLHRGLSTGADAHLAYRLIASNWWRTALWTIRGTLVLVMVLLAG